jgi:hypothetical protein
VAFLPRRRTLPQIAALAAGVLIAVQLTADHWFYLYIPWFLPLVAAALLDTRRPTGQHADVRAHAVTATSRTSLRSMTTPG